MTKVCTINGTVTTIGVSYLITDNSAGSGNETWKQHVSTAIPNCLGTPKIGRISGQKDFMKSNIYALPKVEFVPTNVNLSGR